jgi:hypothetical protein
LMPQPSAACGGKHARSRFISESLLFLQKIVS